ncbi:MAG: class I SAM-dependent methyltransferase [Planctomycetes bacterium]|nr:class I SAM-dependent methyltransferase [Planctomycetota bacterium]
MTVDKIKNVYAFHSYFYDSIFGWLFSQGRLLAIKLMDIKPGQEILEVGVGTGVSLPHYPGHARVVGIDISREMLEKAEERKTSMDLSNVEVREMDAGRLDFADGRFDKVIAAHTMSVVPDPLGVLREMKRVCKDDGEVYILNYMQASNGVVAWFERKISPFREALGLGKYTNFDALIEDAGLVVDHIEKVNFLDLCSLVVCRKKAL